MSECPRDTDGDGDCAGCHCDPNGCRMNVPAMSMEVLDLRDLEVERKFLESLKENGI